MQLEFPFTRVGRFQTYTLSQVGYMDQLYHDFLRASDLQNTTKRKRCWEQMYIDNGMAAEYAASHPPLMDVVEKQNDKVLMRWKGNKPFQNLEDLI